MPAANTGIETGVESHLTVLHLKSRLQFQAVLACPAAARTPHFALHCMLLPSDGQGTSHAVFTTNGTWLGTVVPKRWARRAVTRNTIKRQVFALAPLLESSRSNAAHVVRLRCAFSREQYPSASSSALKRAVRAELTQLFSQLDAPC